MKVVAHWLIIHQLKLNGYAVLCFSQDVCSGQWKEGNVLFNDALNTLYIRLYGIIHMVKDHSDSERGNLLPPQATLSN